MIKKQEFLEQKIEQELQTAKKHGTKNKRGNGGGTGTTREGPGAGGKARASGSDVQGVGWISRPTGFAEEEKVGTAAGTNGRDIIHPGVSA